ncbi:MAG: hypothetical protein Kow0058_01470 [Roseovarius sp.]
MSYIDAILHIADVPALIAWFAANDPGKLDETGQAITGFARTPTVSKGNAALAYVRITPQDEAAFGGAPGVSVLARADYAGPGTPDAVYAALFADPAATALYDAVWDRAPIAVPDGEGGTISYAPPERFGQLG